MKRPFILTAALFSMLAFVSCSNDDDGSGSGGKGDGDGNNAPKVDFFPSHDDNYWIYDMNRRTSGGDSDTAQDSLYVEVESEKQSKFILNVNDGLHQANTIMDRFLTGSCEKSPTSLSIRGGLFSIGLFEGIDVPEDVLFKLVDTKEKSGNLMSTYTQETKRDITDEYSIKFSYTYSTNQLEVLPKGAVINGEEYKKTVAIASMTLKFDSKVKIIYNKTIEFELDLFEDQDAMSIKAYYVDDLGLVRAETDVKLAVNEEIVKKIKEEFDIDIIDIDDVDAKFSFSEVQELTRYNVVLDE